MTDDRQLQLVPAPRKVAMHPGSFEAESKRWYASAAARKHPAIADRLKQLGANLQSGAKVGDWALRIAVPRSDPPGAPGFAQGYTILIEPNGAWLVGNDADGLFYALVTLEQMLEQSTSLPACRIDDWPEMTRRGHHDDISRKQISTVADFKRFLRLLARYKINLYSPYMEDVLHLPSFPDIGEGRGKLMPDQVKEILEEARRCNIEVMPTFSLIGHQENLLQLPAYRHLAAEVFQEPSSLNPANPEVREYLKRAIADVAGMFESPCFHMGFDEVIGVKSDDVLAHANWCADQLASHGKTPVMWVDMIYNHYGYDAINRLKPEIIPVNWYYGDVGEDGVPHHRELSTRRNQLWALAGYRSWCRFWPDFAGVKRHFSGWMDTLRRTGGKTLMASCWGDAGYENHRHLTWNLHAALAEHAWSGPARDMETFEPRFQRTFFGRELPDLEDLVENLHDHLGIDGGESWRLHRRNPRALARMMVAQGDLATRARQDAPRLDEALETISRCRRQARDNADMLEHFAVSLRRMRSVCRRIELAGQYADSGPGPGLKKAVQPVVRDLRATRKAYVSAWLAHNRPENIEVSLEVFDRAIEEFSALSEPAAPALKGGEEDRFELFDLPYDTLHEPIGGIPHGEVRINDVPFRLADLEHTHVLLSQRDDKLELKFEACPASDLHLIAALEKPGEHETTPAVRVEWLRERRVVYHENLLAIRHLCDWWAIYGQHMWAGGDFKYADPLRVKPAISSDPNYDLTHLSGFAPVASPICDSIVLTLLIPNELRIFAATLERPRR